MVTEVEVFQVNANGVFTFVPCKNGLASLALTIFPSIVVRGVQILDISLRERNGLDEVEHGIICGHIVRHLAIRQKFGGNHIPAVRFDFTGGKFVKIQFALVAVISRIENVRNEESFLNQIGSLLNSDASRRVKNRPSHVINQRLCQADFLFVLRGKFPLTDKRKGGGFAIQNQNFHLHKSFPVEFLGLCFDHVYIIP